MDNAMATQADAVERHVVDSMTTGKSVGSSRFDWWVIALSSWLVAGFYLDVWAHHHVEALETFFTPWHGVLYSGFLAVAGFLVAALLRYRTRGASWWRALPDGYELSLLGVLIFAAGGVGDMLWHILVGIEVDLEAALSPTHLLLFLGAGLLLGGPLRAAWRQPERVAARGWVAQLPMLTSLAFTLMIFTAVTEYANPLANPWAAAGHETQPPFLGQALGVTGVLLQTGLLMGTVLVALRRWALRPGSLTLLVALGTNLASFVHDQYLSIVVAVLAGVGADLLLWQLKPSVVRPLTFHLFAFAVPVVLYLLYFLALMLTSGISWSLPLWSGAIFLAGGAGWLVSLLLVPPAPAERLLSQSMTR